MSFAGSRNNRLEEIHGVFSQLSTEKPVRVRFFRTESENSVLKVFRMDEQGRVELSVDRRQVNATISSM
ncbi:MAG: hypothetical protein ACD_75C02273G0001 [uncultured bacterium]|nr:MAG: hypothetical protein ACD_75C02273G0001 [uncultured bacterium]